MAHLLGKSRSFVSQLEIGCCQPSMETVLCYQILFDVDVAALMPEFHQTLHSLLSRRVQAQSQLARKKRGLRLISKRLNDKAIHSTDNNQSYAS